MFFALALAAWLLAAAAWALAATLGIAAEGSFGLPETLFALGSFAAVAGVFCWAAARFGRPPAADDVVTAADAAGVEAPAATPTAGDSVPAGERPATSEAR